MDAAGNASGEARFNFTLDTRAPNAPSIALDTDSGTVGNDLITNDGAFTVTPSEVGNRIEYLVDGSWVTTQPVAVEGINAIIAREVDAAGNASGEARFNFTLDTIVSKLDATLVDVNLDDVVNSQPEFTGSVEPGSAVNIELTKAGTEDTFTFPATVEKDGSWSVSSTNLADGVYSWKVTAIDTAGNHKEFASSENFTLNTVPVVRSFSALSEDTEATPDTELKILETKVFSGESEPNSEIKLTVGGKEQKTLSDEDGDWVIKAEFDQAGTYQYQIEYTDKAGVQQTNSGSETIGRINIETNSPAGENSNASIEHLPSSEYVQSFQPNHTIIDSFDLVDNHETF